MEKDNEMVVVEQSTTTPSLHNHFDIVDVNAAAEFMQNYQDLVEALLTEDDYQDGKKKKSAWRKLAAAFNISDEKVCEKIIRDENYQIISAYFEVKAILPNGRYGIGVGDCSIFDKVKYTDESMPSNFELRKRFNNAEHDVIGTAHTRAKSRAIGDLIGAGEVSAEELSKINPSKPSAPKPIKPTKIDNDDVIEAKAEVVQDNPKNIKPKTPFKTEVVRDPSEFESIDNKAIQKAITELKANDTIIDKDTINDKLLDLVETGAVLEIDYKKAKELLE